MKISLNWLNEFVELTDYFDRPEELSDLLTSAGLEVEGLENLRKQFEHVVIGQILRKGQHPDADRLSVCEVTTGKGVVHQIVCGAKNHSENDFVVAALPGAVLPGDFKIKASSLRGVESQGMLCSFKELGMDGDSEGIIILGDEASHSVGHAAADYFGINDVLFELKVTPNRADCLSHFGLARELSSLLGRELKKPDASLKTQGSSKSLIELNLTNSDLCPRYTGRAIRGVKVGESPQWLKSRLESLGMNSINNVVDITNYVMLELGQPLHAFDVSKLSGNKIIIDNSKAGEKFQTLDGTEISLTGDELMIRDGERAVALAGVVGGLNSGVDENTKDIYLESAYFLPQAVRKSSRFFGIDTDSAYRFSRGVDPTSTDYARDRACHLIAQVAGGEVAGDPHDIYPQPITPKSIQITVSHVAESMGYEVDQVELVDILSKLGCEVKASGENLTVVPPAFRVDLEQDVDLIEEYARVRGYDQIPENLPATTEPPRTHDLSFVLHRALGDELIAVGYSEAQNFAFTGSNYQAGLMGLPEQIQEYGLGVNLGAPVHPRNPLNEELDVMRSMITPSLFKNLMTNYRKGNEQGDLFEIAPVFGVDSNKAYKQEFRLGLVAWGDNLGLWQKEAVPRVIALKAAIEVLLKSLNITSYRWEQAEEKLSPIFHPAQTASLTVEGRKIGLIGSLHPRIKEDQKIRVDVAFAEMNLDSLLKGQPRPYRVKPLSKFPAVERDLALVMPKSLPVGEVVAGIHKKGGALLQRVLVFDIYTGEKLGEDQKSVAFRMKLQSSDTTLSDKELSQWQEKLIEGLQGQFPVSVR